MAAVPAALTLRRQVLSFLSASSAFLGQPAAGDRRATCPIERPSDGGTEDSRSQRHLPEVTKETFFEKLKAVPRLGKAAGELLPRLFIAYALLTDHETPAWAKAIAGTALAYFICPFDVFVDAGTPGGPRRLHPPLPSVVFGSTHDTVSGLTIGVILALLIFVCPVSLNFFGFTCPIFLPSLMSPAPVIGFLDDALVVSIAFETLTKAVTPRVAERGQQLYEESDIKKRLGL